MSEIAKKTPPANAFAIPSILGDSLHDLLKVGNAPQMKASKNTITMKIILVQVAFPESEA